MSEIVPDSSGDLGNTNNPNRARKQDCPKVKWVFTVPIVPDKELDSQALELRRTLMEHCKDFIFQAEKGNETGYLHFQGRLSLTKKMRFTALKSFLGDKAHLEGERDTDASARYCSKSDTRIGGPWTEKAIIRGLINRTTFYEWQAEIYNLTNVYADPRKVYWYWESIGARGKSSFAKWLLINRPETLFIDEGRKGDIMHYIISSKIENWDNPLIIFDVPRENCNVVSYKSIESLKNGIIFSSKYESGVKIFNIPHVVVFANFPPRIDTLSEDRWEIKEL